tara:strand:- start:506 stop:2248 length:1743 start_codon:yes stop_codon:yes gene_type:complete
MAKKTDTVPAMLTPGEVVLNKKQQNKLGKLVGASADKIFKAIDVPGFKGGGKVNSIMDKFIEEESQSIIQGFEDGGYVKDEYVTREDVWKHYKRNGKDVPEELHIIPEDHRTLPQGTIDEVNQLLQRAFDKDIQPYSITRDHEPLGSAGRTGKYKYSGYPEGYSGTLDERINRTQYYDKEKFNQQLKNDPKGDKLFTDIKEGREILAIIKSLKSGQQKADYGSQYGTYPAAHGSQLDPFHTEDWYDVTGYGSKKGRPTATVTGVQEKNKGGKIEKRDKVFDKVKGYEEGGLVNVLDSNYGQNYGDYDTATGKFTGVPDELQSLTASGLNLDIPSVGDSPFDKDQLKGWEDTKYIAKELQNLSNTPGSEVQSKKAQYLLGRGTSDLSFIRHGEHSFTWDENEVWNPSEAGYTMEDYRSEYGVEKLSEGGRVGDQSLEQEEREATVLDLFDNEDAFLTGGAIDASDYMTDDDKRPERDRKTAAGLVKLWNVEQNTMPYIREWSFEQWIDSKFNSPSKGSGFHQLMDSATRPLNELDPHSLESQPWIRDMAVDYFTTYSSFNPETMAKEYAASGLSGFSSMNR